MNIKERFNLWMNAVKSVCDFGTPLNGPALSEFLSDAESELTALRSQLAQLQRQLDEQAKRLAESEEENKGWSEGYGLLLTKESQMEARLADLDKQRPFGYLCDWGDYNGEQRIHMYYGEPGSAIEDDWNDYPRIHRNLALYALPPNLPAMIEQAVRKEREAFTKMLDTPIRQYFSERELRLVFSGIEERDDFASWMIAIRARGEKC